MNYWLYFENGMGNTLLNEAYTVARRNFSGHIQSLQYIICANGFRAVLLNRSLYDIRCFYRVFVERLDDQYRLCLVFGPYQIVLKHCFYVRTILTLVLLRAITRMYASYIFIYTHNKIHPQCLFPLKTRKEMSTGIYEMGVNNISLKM